MGDARLAFAQRQSSSSEQTAGNLLPFPSSAAKSDLEPPFSAQFLDKSPTLSAARAVYLKTMVIGVTGLAFIIFGVCAIFWGSIRSTPHYTIPGWIVDFDGGFVGQQVSETFAGINPGSNGIVWTVAPASQFPEGISQLEHAIVEEQTWVAVAINAGASSNLTAALSSVDASYNSSSVITFIGSEARSEAEYRNLIHPLISTQLEKASRAFALDFARNISLSFNTSALLSIAPQIITEPVSYTINNIRPFDVPLGSAVTFAGLIYILILSFFMVLISNGARQASGLEQHLTLGSLIKVRLGTSFVAYFFVALFYTLLSSAFHLPFDRRFGRAGFVLFWMLTWVGMLACGLALEALATILTVRFVPFFLIFWIISNMSVSGYPLEVLPHIFRFGYAYPFYNISRGVRTIVFSTKNNLGMNFGILIAWAVVSCITLPFFQWLMRRRKAIAAQPKQTVEEKI
ncbi:hypothetical protein DFH07DRAFT_355083 [Mycena maculata]|uniref:DUF3533 domain-containing protein n=1 Tax=Mycena maculata TaxID=230809 RepID=A0AAD7HAK6_9AGAR|nr:hypothetical protein DFH07DRAFT_355083 [Mycena maculata]